MSNAVQVLFHGTGSGHSSLNRGQSSLSCWYQGEGTLVDAGDGTASALLRDRIELNRLSTIFISHFHLDHWIGLPSLIFACLLDGRDKPLVIHLPKNGKDVLTQVLLSSGIELERVPFLSLADICDMTQVAGMQIQSVRNSHVSKNRADLESKGVPYDSYSFEIDVGGKRVFLSQDIGSIDDLPKDAESIDLLVCDLAHIETRDVLGYAVSTRLGHLVGTHITPTMETEINQIDIPVTLRFSVAHDGMSVSV